MSSETAISNNLSKIESSIESACTIVKTARPAVTLVAVSKSQPLTKMQNYAEAARARKLPVIFGENYIQEFSEKSATFNEYDEVHFIGSLQSNKAAKAVQLFDVIQTVSSPKLARLLAQEAKKNLKVQRVLLQVNISDDEAKSGFAFDDLKDFLKNDAPLCPHLAIEGLMTITALYDTPEQARGDFRKMKVLFEELKKERGPTFSKLSMGMSQDFEVAIEEGATIVRVGSALFGERGERKGVDP